MKKFMLCGILALSGLFVSDKVIACDYDEVVEVRRVVRQRPVYQLEVQEFEEVIVHPQVRVRTRVIREDVKFVEFRGQKIVRFAPVTKTVVRTRTKTISR